MKMYADDINYSVAEEREKLVRHDVMSHVYAFSVSSAKGNAYYPPWGYFLLCWG